MSTGIKVFAPATVANVAVGFDVLGFAIDKPGDELILRLTDKPGVRITKITGSKKQLPTDPQKNTAGVAAISLLKHLNTQQGIEMEIHKKMPIGSGLGSSAASAAAAVVGINHLLKNPLSKRDLIPFAVDGEQIASGAYHADNVAPSIIGGIVFIRDNSTFDLHRLPVPPGLFATVVYPHINILTKDARNALSENVTLKNCIEQTGNLGGFIIGLFNSNIGLIEQSLHDAIIEPQRAHLIPGFSDVKKAALENGAMGCSISGAGPSIFALSMNSLKAEQAGVAMKNAFLQHGIESTTYISMINQDGARVM